MNKTIKEQAVEYANKYYFNAPGMGVIHLVEAVSTEERKRRLPSKEEFQKEYLNAIGDHREVTNHLYDWLLSYEGEHIAEVNEKVGEDYQAKYNEAMVIIKRQSGDLTLLKERNHKLDSENIELRKENKDLLFYVDVNPINRNELAEKIMLSAVMIDEVNIPDEEIVKGCFSLADEFIKQSKG